MKGLGQSSTPSVKTVDVNVEGTIKDGVKATRNSVSEKESLNWVRIHPGTQAKVERFLEDLRRTMSSVTNASRLQSLVYYYDGDCDIEITLRKKGFVLTVVGLKRPESSRP